MTKISKKDAKVIDSFIEMCCHLKQFTRQNVPSPYYIAWLILIQGINDYRDDVKMTYVSEALNYWMDHKEEK